MNNKIPSSLRYVSQKQLRVISVLIFVISIILISMNINFPNYLKPEGYWYSTYSIQGHTGDNFIFKFTVHAPNIEARSTKFFNFDQYTYQLDSIQYSFVPDKYNKETPPNSICIDKLIISDGLLLGENLLNKLSLLCRKVEERAQNFFTFIIDIHSITNESIDYLVLPHFNTFYYPFTKTTNLMIFQVIYHTIKNGLESEKKTLIPGLDVFIDDQTRWDIDLNDLEYSLPAEISKDSLFINGEAAFIETIISGPLYFQILSIFLILGMASLIGLMMFIESTSSFTQAVAAMLFGLYGARQILTPQSVQAKTILDVIFIFLYAFVVYTIVDHYLFKVIRARKVSRLNYPFVAVASSKTFHDISCVYLQKIPENKRIYLKNKQEAKERNLDYCKRCLSKNLSIK